VSDVEEQFQVEVVEGSVLGNNLADLVEVLRAEVSEGFDAVDVLTHELWAAEAVSLGGKEREGGRRARGGRD
jgi:hypothetical protein